MCVGLNLEYFFNLSHSFGRISEFNRTMSQTAFVKILWTIPRYSPKYFTYITSKFVDIIFNLESNYNTIETYRFIKV